MSTVTGQPLANASRNPLIRTEVKLGINWSCRTRTSSRGSMFRDACVAKESCKDGDRWVRATEDWSTSGRGRLVGSAAPRRTFTKRARMSFVKGIEVEGRGWKERRITRDFKGQSEGHPSHEFMHGRGPANKRTCPEGSAAADQKRKVTPRHRTDHPENHRPSSWRAS